MSSEYVVPATRMADRPNGDRTSDRPDPRTGSAVRGRVLGVVAGVAVAATVLAGCGGSPPTAGSGPGPVSTPRSSPALASQKATDPNASEVNAAGDIPDSQVFVPFTPPGESFVVSVPQGWAQSDRGAATVFTDKFNSVRIEARPRATAPDVASVRAQDLPQLQSSVPGFALGDVTMVQRSVGEAVLVTYGATSAPNAVTGKTVTESVERYAFWWNGEEVVLTLSGPQGADNVDPWRKITDSLRWM